MAALAPPRRKPGRVGLTPWDWQPEGPHILPTIWQNRMRQLKPEGEESNLAGAGDAVSQHHPCAAKPHRSSQEGGGGAKGLEGSDELPKPEEPVPSVNSGLWRRALHSLRVCRQRPGAPPGQ
ncbi:unnamed protein product [Caretta caretta]